MSGTTLRILPVLGVAGVLAACGPQAPPPEAPAPTAPAAAAREAPPPPMPLQPLEFPPFREFRLPNGVQVIVVEKHDVPIANVNLYVKSGTATDPVEKMGLTEMAASLLDNGTQRRTARQIAETIEGVGGSLNTGAGLDFITVSSNVLAGHLPLAMDLVSDVALRPTFPEEELETERRRTLSGLQVALSRPGELARRRFIYEIYGEESPYAGAPIPQTIQAIGRQDLLRFHQRHFQPDNALLVVSGDVDPAAVEELARRHFGGWQGGAQLPPVTIDPPAQGPAEITLIHRPGSVQSAIMVGNVAIRPDNPDYYPLQVMNKIVGGGTDARLFLILREERGWTYGAYSQVSRPREAGYYMATAEVRTEVTDSALAEMMHQLRRVREEPVSPQELESAKSFLVGSFPLRIETAGQIASQVAQTRLLGLSTEDLTRYRERIGAVTIQDVQRVAQQYVRPEQATIVVVGDATRVLDDLRRIAPVALLDVEGAPLPASAVEVRASAERFDADVLRPQTLAYQVLIQGNPLGTGTARLTKEGEVWVGVSSLQAGPLNQQSEVRFGAGLTPISSVQVTSQGPVQIRSDLRYQDGRVVGTVQLPPEAGGDREIDTEVPAGTLLPGMDEYVMQAAELAPGKTITVPVFSAQSASVANLVLRVAGEEEVTVPAGTFPAYRVEGSVGPQSFTVWLRREAPHTVLRQDFTGQPVSIVLQSVQ